MQYLCAARRVEEQVLEVFLFQGKVCRVQLFAQRFFQCFGAVNAAPLAQEVVIGRGLLPKEDGVVEVAPFGTGKQCG